MAADGKRRAFFLATAGIWVDLIVIALGLSWPLHEIAFYAVERRTGNEVLRKAVCAVAHYSFLGIPLTLGAIALVRFSVRCNPAAERRPSPWFCIASLGFVLVASPMNPFAYFIRALTIHDFNTRTMLDSADHEAVAQACAYLVAHADEYVGRVEFSDPRLPAAIGSLRTRHQPPFVGISRNGVRILHGAGGFFELLGYWFRQESPDSWGLYSRTPEAARLVSGLKLPAKRGTTGQSGS